MKIYSIELRDGQPRIRGEGDTGDGEISNLSPQVCMQMAVLLARGARARGAEWPVPFDNDPWDAGATLGLEVALGEQPPDAVTADFRLDPRTFERDLSAVRGQLRAALAVLNELIPGQST